MELGRSAVQFINTEREDAQVSDRLRRDSANGSGQQLLVRIHQLL